MHLFLVDPYPILRGLCESSWTLLWNTTPYYIFKKQNRNMKDWTLSLKQFLSNRKKELPQIFCSCPHLDFLIFWPQQIRLCVVLAQYHKHLPFFFFHLFILLPAKPKFLQFHLNWIVYPFALSSHTHETLPHLDFVSGKPLSILIPAWAQQNSQTHSDLGTWLNRTSSSS